VRVKAIRLGWFRGAADGDVLEINGKSMVVYGQNGAGKSSFVDAIEYVIRDTSVRYNFLIKQGFPSNHIN
jgi:AAA15 family ATPase/GTPase